MRSCLELADGRWIPLDVFRWRAEADGTEVALLADLEDPVLDIGCGPGRLTAALSACGRLALGIDPAPGAVVQATGRGASALRRSVFTPIPGEGRWASALLIDGNIGIGGDPVVLLRRVVELLRPAGVVLVELDAPGEPTEVVTVRLSTVDDNTQDEAIRPGRTLRLIRRRDELGRGGNIRPERVSPWFRWARVGTDDWERIGREAGLTTRSVVERGGRWFAHASAHDPVAVDV